MSGNIVCSFSPHYSRKSFQLLGRRVVSIFSGPGFSPVVSLFLPSLIQGEIEDCVLYQLTALPKPDIGFAQSSELILETLSIIFIRHRSETCLASGSTIILKLPLDSLDVVTEVHIS